MIGLEAPQEKDVATGPHVWIQWKGTDVCCDFRCACGATGHIDADFMYFIACPACGQLYEVGTHVRLYPITKEQHWGCEPVVPSHVQPAPPSDTEERHE